MDGTVPSDGSGRPWNRPTNESLRRIEVAAFAALLFLLSAALAYRGILFLLAGEAVFPVLGFTLTGPLHFAASGLYLVLASGIAAATAAMAVRFRR